jgi:hypothetical protein
MRTPLMWLLRKSLSASFPDHHSHPGAAEMIFLEAYLITSFASCLFYVVRFWRSDHVVQLNKEQRNG